MKFQRITGADPGDAKYFERLIKERIAAAWPGQEEQIGRFAARMPIPDGAINHALSVDGVGTKSKHAARLQRFDGIGQDAVAMGVGDVLCDGVKPAFIADILKVDHLVPAVHIEIIDSIIAACKIADCILVGGETAQMKNFYRHPWMFDLDVAAVGLSGAAWSFSPVRPGQLVYGWPSRGPCANGFTLLSEVFGLDDDPETAREHLGTYWDELGTTLADALLEPTPIWLAEIETQLRRGVKFAGHAHITGDGIPGNVPRIKMPEDCQVVIERGSWERPPIFSLTQGIGGISQERMDGEFNQGIIFVSIVDQDGPAIDDPNAILIGRVRKRRDKEPRFVMTGHSSNKLL